MGVVFNAKASSILPTQVWSFVEKTETGVHPTPLLSHNQTHKLVSAHTHHVLQRDNMNSCNPSK